MLALIILCLIGVWTLWRPIAVLEEPTKKSDKLTSKLDRLWVIAQDSLKERRYLRAEKALLTILRVDERNASAYNRLGILYAKQQDYRDAIECFEIAQSLEPSASSLHNVGLIYFETEQYDKAGQAFEQALSMEDNVPSRYIAYAKVQEKLGHTKKMIGSLEAAIRIEPSIQAFKILADAYEQNGEIERADKIRQKINRAHLRKSSLAQNIRQVRKVQI